MEIKFKMEPGCEDLAPKKNNDTDAGYDLATIEDYNIYPGQTVMVKTGLFLELPEGYEAQVRSRSGLALKHGIMVKNSPGTIDADYRGMCNVLLSKELNITNAIGGFWDSMSKMVTVGKNDDIKNHDHRGNLFVTYLDSYIKYGYFKIQRGDRVAQLVIYKLDDTKLVKVDEINSTIRGEKGFGSSGVNKF